jgi:hypothetical protein
MATIVWMWDEAISFRDEQNQKAPAEAGAFELS